MQKNKGKQKFAKDKIAPQHKYITTGQCQRNTSSCLSYILLGAVGLDYSSVLSAGTPSWKSPLIEAIITKII